MVTGLMDLPMDLVHQCIDAPDVKALRSICRAMHSMFPLPSRSMLDEGNTRRA